MKFFKLEDGTVINPEKICFVNITKDFRRDWHRVNFVFQSGAEVYHSCNNIQDAQNVLNQFVEFCEDEKPFAWITRESIHPRPSNTANIPLYKRP